MSSVPELKGYMGKKVSIQLNGARKVIGVLKGYDIFLNVTLVDSLEEQKDGEHINIGSVVVRGNSIVSLEALEKI